MGRELARGTFLDSTVVANYVSNFLAMQFYISNLVSCYLVSNNAFEEQCPGPGGTACDATLLKSVLAAPLPELSGTREKQTQTFGHQRH